MAITSHKAARNRKCHQWSNKSKTHAGQPMVARFFCAFGPLSSRCYSHCAPIYIHPLMDSYKFSPKKY